MLETGGCLIWESCSEISVALKAEAFSGEEEQTQQVFGISSEKTKTFKPDLTAKGHKLMVSCEIYW